MTDGMSAGSACPAMDVEAAMRACVSACVTRDEAEAERIAQGEFARRRSLFDGGAQEVPQSQAVVGTPALGHDTTAGADTDMGPPGRKTRLMSIADGWAPHLPPGYFSSALGCSATGSDGFAPQLAYTDAMRAADAARPFDLRPDVTNPRLLKKIEMLRSCMAPGGRADSTAAQPTEAAADECEPDAKAQRADVIVGADGLAAKLNYIVDTFDDDVMLVFDFDNTLVTTDATTRVMQPQGGQALKDALARFKPEDCYVLSARNTESKVGALVDTLCQLDLQRFFNVEQGGEFRTATIEDIEGDPVRIKISGRVVGAGLFDTKASAIAYLLSQMSRQPRHVFFFDDNVVNAFMVAKHTAAFIKKYEGLSQPTVHSHWIDIFAQLSTIHVNMQDNDFPYLTEQRKIAREDGTKERRTELLYDEYLLYYGVTSELGKMRLDKYVDHYKGVEDSEA